MTDHPKTDSTGSKIGRFNQSRLDMRMCTLESDFTYTSNINPCAFFWKHLSKQNQQGALCWIPDTFVLNDPDVPLMWIYSNAQGCVEKNVNVTLK
jgi:hypothetical protein